MKSLPWFRMYHEAIDDEKLRLLACEDRWHFIALLCCKAKGILDEAGSLLRRKVAVKLGLSTNELDEVARRLAEVGLINSTTLQPLAWDERQFQSDSSAERVKAHREKVKRYGNVTVTAQETETETDTEKDKEEQPAVAARATRKCPEGFTVTSELNNWAATNAPAVDVCSATDKFRDHTFRTAITDWAGAWRNWLRKDQEYAVSQQARGQSRQSLQAKTINELTGGLASVKDFNHALSLT